jgi:hypothetical protein
MTTKIPLSIIVQITSDDINNDSTVAGAALSDVLEQLDTDLGNLNDFDYSQAGDPAVDTDPTSVGASWKNNTSGEIFICIDNTAGSNVWVGTAGNTIETISPRQGTNFGYYAGGTTTVGTNVIERFAFASTSNGANIGSLTGNNMATHGNASSATDGYISAGQVSGTTTPLNAIKKFAFTTSTSETDLGDVTVARRTCSGCNSDTNGYTQGGYGTSGPNYNIIDKYDFVSANNATDVGDLTVARRIPVGNSGIDYGYTHGGLFSTASYANFIDRFPFASDANATDVGDLTVARYGACSGQSDTHGYAMGGGISGNVVNTIDKYQYTSLANATDVGDLIQIRATYNGGTSTPDHGYAAGGSGGGQWNIIERVSFASDGNATDVGDLTESKYYATGHQN